MFTEQSYGNVTVLRADNGGVLPYGNSVLVRGSDRNLLVDPSLSVQEAVLAGTDLPVDAVLVSHAHEDHIGGLRFFDVPRYVHHLDRPAVASLEALLDGYGLDADAREQLHTSFVETFHLPETHDNVDGIDDGFTLDLGDRTATVIHLPGHTAGHCGLVIEPDGFFYVADIDLSSFGPMYGDLGSSLESFLTSLDLAGSIDARWYGTFHHKGVVAGATEFRKRLAGFRHRIVEREERLLAFLAEPRTLDEIVAHRLVYRPHVDAPYVDAVERRTAELHLARLIAQDRVMAPEPGRYRGNGS
ncbi:MAG: MBL fold metallo-hydrolase [Gordonia sp. (in: high G+C Gram-positive bacteria)]